MDYALLDDEILTKLLKADDEAAFKEVYMRHWKSIFNNAYYRIGSKEAAQELVQNLFLNIWDKRHTLKIGNLENYLHAAIKNRVINYIETTLVHRKYQQYVHDNTTDHSMDTQVTLQYNEFYRAFERAVRQLPPKTRDVFTMSRLEHLSVKEIAARLNISEKAVEYHITSSLKSLRISLKEFMPGVFFAAAITCL